MSEIALAGRALEIPGRCIGIELARVYELGLKAPPGLPMIELGTLHGRTTAMLCGAAQNIGSEVITIDNYTQDPIFVGGRDKLPGEPDPHRPPEEYAEFTRQNLAKLGFQPRIIIGESTTIPKGVTEIGLLLIDSKHTYKLFNAECDTWLPLMVKGGILVCHDYNSIRWPEMTVAINQRFRGQMEEWKCLGIMLCLIAFRKR